MPPDALRFAAADDNFRLAQTVFMTGGPRGEVHITRDHQLVCCGLPAGDFNYVAPSPGSEQTEAALGAADEYFGARGFPYHAKVDDRSASQHEAALRDAGWAPDGDPDPALWMALESATVRAAAARAAEAAKGLSVRPVTGSADRARFAETAFRGFGLPTQIAHDFLSDRLLARPMVELFLGCVDETPVCTSLLVRTAHVAGLYWVATLDRWRGHGFAEAVSWAAVAAGVAHGCTLASLQASKPGRPVYERMGFTHGYDYLRWDPPVPQH